MSSIFGETLQFTKESIYGVSFPDEFEHGVQLGDALSMKLDGFSNGKAFNFGKTEQPHSKTT